MRAASNLYISSSSISGVTIAFYSSSPISPCRNSYSEWVWRWSHNCMESLPSLPFYRRGKKPTMTN
ncbi:hypothetical protein CIPAW_10G120000 [Carya illinoinensis]|uniref:Uncharacterized protein n=1 Tax=Carya illinoinensis TaxID=32201 RepID=A0A8T1PDB7_CARIL|nr:hypothetical protein CIPAW_10G120000 [Carya illinoinensis]